MTKDELKAKTYEQIERRREDMIAVAKTMLGHPELGYREVKTSAMIREVLEGLRLPVREGLALTGVEGVLEGRTTGPVVVVMGELDSVACRESPLADPVTGAAHLCGHHIQVASMLGAAMGLVGAGVAPFLAGRVKFLGCPAEEYLEIEHRLQLRREGKIRFLGGKQELIQLGYFDDVAMAMMVHAAANVPEPGFLMNGTGNGFVAKFIRYEGKPSHAGAAPHLGVNALNAACLGIMAVHAQRETFQDQDAIRVHPIITKGGDAVNVVPSDVTLESYVRGRSLDAILDAAAKVDRAFKAGGDAVGAATAITNVPGYLPIFQDQNLTEIASRNGRALMGDRGALNAGFIGGSFDVGDLSHLLPVLHPFVGGTQGSLHAAEFRIVDYQAAVVAPAKLMAACVIDLLADEAREAVRVKAEFRPRLTRAAYLDLMRRMT